MMDTSELDEVITEFIVESHEYLDQLDQELVVLEQHPEPDVGENLVSKLRDGELRVTTEVTTALLTMVDAVRAILAAVESGGHEGTEDYAALRAELGRLDRDEAAPAAVAVVAEAVEAEPEPDPEPSAPTTTGAGASAASDTIRVDVELLDDLMNLVGELVLARNQILQYTGTQSDSTFNATTQRLNLITTELQVGVMRTRMQPIETSGTSSHASFAT